MKYIALDIGNVCIQIDHNGCYSKAGFTGTPPQEVMFLAREYECGRLTEDEFWTAFQQYAPDKTKSRQELEKNFDYKPSTSLREGLRKFAKWYKEYYM
jgi:nucleoside-diphosphate-sugar epimerase